MNKKLLFVVALALLVLIALAGCAASGEPVATIDWDATSAPPSETEPVEVEFDLDSCPAFSTETGYPLHEGASTQAEACLYLEPTPETPEAVDPTPDPTMEPDPTPEAHPACALIGNPTIGSVCFPRELDPTSGDLLPYRIPVAEGGYTLVALGLGTFNGQVLAPVSAEIGHIVVISGTMADGTTPADLNKGVTLTGYVPGSVAVTHIVTPDTPAFVAGENHARGMTNPPNCGAEGCNYGYLWFWNWETSSLDLVEIFDFTSE